MLGIVYCIREISTNDILYIGSTTSLYNRKATHLSDCFRKKSKHSDYPLYKHVRNICNRNEFYNYFTFDILYENSVLTRDELNNIERAYIEKLTPKFNKVKRPSITDEEKKELTTKWISENLESYKEVEKNAHRRWVENHKAELREKHRKYMREYYAKHKNQK